MSDRPAAPAPENPAVPQQPPSYYDNSQSQLRDYYAPRVRDFEPASCGTSIREPDAASLLPSYASVAKPWGRYNSEQAYLNALREFVKEKDYAEGPVDNQGNPVGIHGFYGTKTGADYAAGPGLRDGRKKSKSQKQNAGSKDEAPKDARARNTGGGNRTRSGIKQWLGRSRADSSSD